MAKTYEQEAGEAMLPESRHGNVDKPIVKDTVVISAFPGTGKTHYTTLHGTEVLDSDSSKFRWSSVGVHNPKWPHNYINHIKANIGLYDVIMASTHKEVRYYMTEANIKFILVHPLREEKAAYLKRFRNRGDAEFFVEMMEEHWDEYIDSMYEQPNYSKIAILLVPGTYLSRYISMAKDIHRNMKSYE